MMQNIFAHLYASTTSSPMDNEYPNYQSINTTPASSSTIPLQPSIPVPSTLPNYTTLPYPSLFGPTGYVTGMPESLRQHEFSSENERKMICKVARNRRRFLARQRSLTVSRQSPPVASLTLERRMDTDDPLHEQESNRTRSELYTFLAPNGKKLRVLLTKELKSSDVSSLGRIVLPKKEVEENLPILYHKEGIQIVFKDIHSDKEWEMRFKYWSNNRSRMYVLESTGEFVRQEGLGIGDAITLYEDQQKNLFISKKKRGQANFHTAVNERNEEQALVHKDSIASSSGSKIDHLDIDDFYGGLGILPELNRFDYFVFD